MMCLSHFHTINGFIQIYVIAYAILCLPLILRDTRLFPLMNNTDA